MWSSGCGFGLTTLDVEATGLQYMNVLKTGVTQPISQKNDVIISLSDAMNTFLELDERHNCSIKQDTSKN